MNLDKIELLEFARVAVDLGFNYYFKVFSSGKEYTLRIVVNELEVIEWSCTCPYASTYRFSKKNQIEDKPCKHTSYAISKLKYLGYLKT